MGETYIVPGVRTPFAKANGVFAAMDAVQLSVTVLQAMERRTRPDLLLWGSVIPSPVVSNIAREAWLDAGLDPSVPAATTVHACATSLVAAIEAAGVISRGAASLALAGGVETMSHVPIALKQPYADNISRLSAKAPMEALAALRNATPDDFVLPVRGWANRISGRSMGEHTEDTAKVFSIKREDQDRIASQSHHNAGAAIASGFFDDLIVPVADVVRDNIPRADSTLEKLQSLPPVFDRSAAGSLTAGNSSPLTDGAAGVWVCDKSGLSRVGAAGPAVLLVDWQFAAMDYREEGILMAPARALPKLLARNRLRFEAVHVWEIHEAFAAQVLANIKAASDPLYRREKAGVDFDLGAFPWERLNRKGGSLALGHPFGATGARILSQAAKLLSTEAPGAFGVVSVCADGGQGVVALLRNP